MKKFFPAAILIFVVGVFAPLNSLFIRMTPEGFAQVTTTCARSLIR